MCNFSSKIEVLLPAKSSALFIIDLFESGWWGFGWTRLVPKPEGWGSSITIYWMSKMDVRHRVAGNAHGLSKEEESRINEDFEDANCGSKELVQPKADQQRPQPRSQGSLVRWESFLPLRSLKVLLVENDDSTRHVVCALLRNCSYEGNRLLLSPLVCLFRSTRAL